MAELEKGQCACKSCKEDRKALQRQLDHQFYKDADAFRDEIKAATMRKAAKKYKEPFNPASWTIEELAKHAMAENYDQQNYIYRYLRKRNWERTYDEVCLLLFDLSRKGEVNPRKTGLLEGIE